MEEPLSRAPISYCVSTYFDTEFSNKLIQINHILTKKFGLGTYALNNWWLPHLTLFQGGTDQEGVNELIHSLDNIFPEVADTEIHFSEFESTDSGLLLLIAELSPTLISLEQKVANTCSELHMRRPLYRPRVIDKWSLLTEKVKKQVRHTGSYKTGELFQPHISIAGIKDTNSRNILHIAKSLLSLPIALRIQSFVFVNAGHNNENGAVISQWPKK